MYLGEGLPVTAPKRKGRYSKTADRIQGEPPVWGAEDDALLVRLREQSPLKHDTAKESLTRTVVQCEIQIRGLMAMTVRNADEERALTQAQSAKMKALVSLMLTKEEADDPEDGDDDE